MLTECVGRGLGDEHLIVVECTDERLDVAGSDARRQLASTSPHRRVRITDRRGDERLDLALARDAGQGAECAAPNHGCVVVDREPFQRFERRFVVIAVVLAVVVGVVSAVSPAVVVAERSCRRRPTDGIGLGAHVGELHPVHAPDPTASARGGIARGFWQSVRTLSRDRWTQVLNEAEPLITNAPPPSDARRQRRWWHRVPPWAWIVATVLAVLMALTSIVLTFIDLPYYTISPGAALDVSTKISIEGEPVETPGEVNLLFVRQRSRVNGWDYIWARLDEDIDLFDEAEISGGLPPGDVRKIAEAEMLRSQQSAKKVALEQLGYDVPFADAGVAVLAVFDGRPAEGLLEAGDVLVSANGVDLPDLDALAAALSELAPGDEVDLEIDRDGEILTVTVGTVANEEGRATVGIYVSRLYAFPVDIEIDTNSIGGPSAGLAMTLSILDALSPADLTGSMSIAATGTILPDGTVGQVGGVDQKVGSARANDVDLLLVPTEELAEAEPRAKDLPVVGVADIGDALAALEAAGGEPLTPSEGVIAA